MRKPAFCICITKGQIRKCSLCNVLEDEFHFVLECNMLTELRKKYISRYYWNRPSMHKFISLINNQNQTCIRKLSTFIFQALNYEQNLFTDINNVFIY